MNKSIDDLTDAEAASVRATVERARSYSPDDAEVACQALMDMASGGGLPPLYAADVDALVRQAYRLPARRTGRDREKVLGVLEGPRVSIAHSLARLLAAPAELVSELTSVVSDGIEARRSRSDFEANMRAINNDADELARLDDLGLRIIVDAELDKIKPADGVAKVGEAEPVREAGSPIAEAEAVIATHGLRSEPTFVARMLERVRESKARGDNPSQAYHAAAQPASPGSARAKAAEAAVCHVFGIDHTRADYVPVWKMSWKQSEAIAAPKKKAVVLRGHHVRPRMPEALWPGLVYYGTGTLLFGMPGIGKSTIVNDIAARVTVGAPMPGEPDDADHEPRSVVILTAEDSPEEVIAPQLVAAGAEMTQRLHR